MSWNRKTSRHDRKDRKRKEHVFIGGIFYPNEMNEKLTRETFERRQRKRRRQLGFNPLTMNDLDRVFVSLRADSVFTLFGITRAQWMYTVAGVMPTI